MTLSCTCLSEDFRDVLAVVADVARNPVFPEDEIDEAARRDDHRDPAGPRQSRRSAPARRCRRCSTATIASVRPAGEGHASRASSGSAASDLRAFHAATFRARRRCSLVIVGDVAPREARSHRPRGIRRLDAVRRAGARGAAVGRRGRRGSRSSSTCRTSRSPTSPTASPASAAWIPAYCHHWVMNNILGQFGLGGRLAENIRERQGMAYYAFSSFDPSLGAGPAGRSAPASIPANVERAIAAIDARSRRARRRRRDRAGAGSKRASS